MSLNPRRITPRPVGHFSFCLLLLTAPVIILAGMVSTGSIDAALVHEELAPQKLRRRAGAA